jgi:mannose-6-phosphate isomerase-like protein (cupin superfamily)
LNERNIAHLPVLPTSDPSFAAIAHMVTLPDVDPASGIQFFPAFDGFDTGEDGSQRIDVSYLYVPWHRDPLTDFDKHPNNEELFVVLQGDFYMVIGSADGGELPQVEEMRCYHIKQGDIFIQKKNVWHTACWPLDASRPVKYLMILSGHRSASGGAADSTQGTGNRVDHHMRSLPDNYAVLPQFDTPADMR